jgi:hypothetical protein
MASEGTFTVPRMASFKRSFLGYRRTEVDAALASRDARNWALERDAQEAIERCRESDQAAAEAEQELGSLSAMVIEREREIRGLLERLSEANERHDRNVSSLESVSARLEDIQAQARGQATRIRMKALREAVEVGRRAQELSEAQAASAPPAPSAPNGNGNGHAGPTVRDVFEGLVKVEIGPLDDFSQLVGFEDAAGQIGSTSEISVERFSEGRATLSMRLSEPTDLLHELEQRSPLDFHVRRTADDNVVLDIDDEAGPEQRAA